MNKRQDPTKILIDEFAALRKATFITNAMATMRGSGVAFHLMFQAASQARDTYGEGWEQILGLSAVIQYFGGTADPLTAEVISKTVGMKTIVVGGESVNPGQLGSGNSYSLAGRPVLMPDEVMRWPMPIFLAVFTGKGAVMGRLVNPDLSDFHDYQLFMAGIKEGYAPDVCAKSVWGMVDYRERKARESAEPSPQSALVKGSLLRRLLDRTLSAKPQSVRTAKPLTGEDWFDSLIRKIMGHESQ